MPFGARKWWSNQKVVKGREENVPLVWPVVVQYPDYSKKEWKKNDVCNMPGRSAGVRGHDSCSRTFWCACWYLTRMQRGARKRPNLRISVGRGGTWIAESASLSTLVRFMNISVNFIASRKSTSKIPVRPHIIFAYMSIKSFIFISNSMVKNISHSESSVIGRKLFDWISYDQPLKYFLLHVIKVK